MGRRWHSPTAMALRAADHAVKALAYHCAECARCDRAQRDTLPMIYCEVGWILAKSATRTANLAQAAREREANPVGADQLALF